MSTWRHKDIFSRDGENFMVQVSRHEERGDDYEGPHRWCVYAYIYPKHPLFGEFSGPAMYQPAATAMPLHCGPSLLRWHYYDDGKPSSVQVGADYHHLHDERFTFYETKGEAAAVFADAEALFSYLTAHAKEREQDPTTT